ncbi:MAG: DUF2510 domain-containing protein [Rhodoglobus sp.]
MSDESKRAGWYPDPDNAGGERWWNGAGWSDSRRGGAAAAASSPYAPAATGTAATLAPGVPNIPMPAVPLPPAGYSAGSSAPPRPNPYAQPYATPQVGSSTSINVSVNRNAMIGFITGLVSLFFNLFFVLAPLAIVFSALGLVKARALAAQGTPRNLLVYAVIGLVCGVIAVVMSVFTIAAFFLALSTPSYGS